jgi:hypothetical protein
MNNPYVLFYDYCTYYNTTIMILLIKSLVAQMQDSMAHKFEEFALDGQLSYMGPGC